MVTWLLAGMALYLVNVQLAGLLLLSKVGPRIYAGPRDDLPPDGVTRARALKAAQNFAENLPVFLGLGILAMVIPTADQQLAIVGAQLFVLSRVAYIAVYVSGIPYLRSVIFTAGIVGLGLMAFALL